MTQALIIDDVDVSRYAISLALDEFGISYAQARSLAEAKKELRKNSPSVVFVDWHLKKESGLDLIQEIKSHSKARVFVISGVEGQEKASQTTQAGADGFLVKPVDSASIRKCLDQAGL